MRCAECGYYECCMRTPLGGCPNGEKAEPVRIFTAPDTRPWEGVNRPGITVHPIAIISAAQDLVDAVERYVEPKPGQEFVHRSEILLKKNALKKLL